MDWSKCHKTRDDYETVFAWSECGTRIWTVNRRGFVHLYLRNSNVPITAPVLFDLPNLIWGWRTCP